MRSRGGFSRGPDVPEPAEMRAPNLWLLDYREGGTFCVADPARLMLWRPHMESDQLLKIEQGTKTETVAFVAGAHSRTWPAAPPTVEYAGDSSLPDAGLAAPAAVGVAALGGRAAAADRAAPKPQPQGS